MESQKKKCLFLVQGEGHGHMTQSISMKQLLEKVGIEVCEVIIGKSKQRQIPDFYFKKIRTDVCEIDSPNMSMGKKHRAVKLLPTLVQNILAIPSFIKSLRIIDKKIKEIKPDIIINFFEPLCGIYYMFFRPSVPIVSVAHHYMFLHSDYIMPKGNYISSIGLKIYTRLTALGSTKRLALSFYPFNNDTEKSIYPVPPLLRNEVLHHSVGTENYILIYILNSGYIEDIVNWHKQNPDTMLHCFTDKEDMGDTEQYDKTLYFHKLNDLKFLTMMANAGGVVTTAGFESVCEAMYMGKPVFTIPVEKDYEQFCNSRDAARTKLSIYSEKFDISSFLHYMNTHRGDNKEFSAWVEKAHQLITRHVLNVLKGGDNIN